MGGDEESRLIEKLRRVEALYSRAAHAGEKAAATERLVFTSALTAGWRPAPLAEHGFPMTVILTLGDTADGGTQYDALVLHRDAAGRDRHLAMGFHEGWGQAADQLDELALTL